MGDMLPMDIPLDHLLDPKNGAALARHSVVIEGHRTSISIEDAFWSALKRLCDQDQVSLNHRITEIDAARQGNLSSAIRLYVLARLQQG